MLNKAVLLLVVLKALLVVVNLAVLEGKLYIVFKKKEGSAWHEAYVRLPATAHKIWQHKQRVWVCDFDPRVNNNSELQNLLIQLFVSCFQDPQLSQLIISDPKRRELVERIVALIEGGEKV